MIRSMTGYGSASETGEHGEFVVEIRSVNNRHLDLSLRLPRELSSLEPAVRDALRARLQRGKVDVFVRWVPSPAAPPLCEINVGLLQHYITQLSPALQSAGAATLDLAALLTLPGVVIPTAVVREGDALERALLRAVEAALVAFDRARVDEGRALAAALRAHLAAVEEAVEAIAQLKPGLDALMLERLAERIRRVAEAAGVAPEAGRIEMELALAADKADVTEELVRLRAHIAAFRKKLESHNGEPVGKNFDFLAQELHRELTTLGNKARGTEIASHLLRAKNELEKIREQVQNIE
jgi:uncharacterized protein (TIGR00255 family)